MKQTTLETCGTVNLHRPTPTAAYGCFDRRVVFDLPPSSLAWVGTPAGRTDLILLDMLMEGVDGWRFLEVLQHWPQRLAVPIIVTTGTILTREWAEQNGCQGFLRKPIEEQALFEEVERCLGHLH